MVDAKLHSIYLTPVKHTECIENVSSEKHCEEILAD